MNKFLAAVSIFGCLALIAGNIVGMILVENHDPIADTISMLAIGKYGWVQDLGLDIFALSFVAMAVGLYRIQSGDWKWKAGLVCMILIAVDIVVIAEHNQYAGRGGEGESIHMQAVYVMAGLFLLSCFFLAQNIRSVNFNWSAYSKWSGIAWMILSPLFFVMPDSLDGLYERGVGIIMVMWLLVLSYITYRALE